jgi:hypothetical protein
LLRSCLSTLLHHPHPFREWLVAWKLGSLAVWFP